jgi:hypothetical protein
MKITQTLLILASSTAIMGFYSSAARAGAVLRTSFPLTPTPSTLNVPIGGFTGGQTFTFSHFWDNTWDEPIQVTFNYQLVEVDSFFDDPFNFTSTFTIPGNTFNQQISTRATLTADDLNNTNGFFEGGVLEFSVQSPTFTEAHVPEPLTMLGVGTAVGFGAMFKRQLSKNKQLN